MPISNPKEIVFVDSIKYLILPPSEDVIVTFASTIVAHTNEDRKGLTIFNHCAYKVYFDIQENVSPTSFMFFLEPLSYYEMPSPVFCNTIYAITHQGSGNLTIREIVVQ